MLLALNTASLILYLISCWFLLQHFSRHAIMMAYLFLVQVWSVISCYYNDLGIYNPELFQDTHPSLATSRLVLFYLIFNFGFWFVGFVTGKRELTPVHYAFPGIKKPMALIKLTVTMLFVGIAGYILLYWATNGIPVFRGVHKAESFDSADPFGMVLQEFGWLLAFLLGLFRLWRKGFQPSDGFIALYLVFMLSLGHKFSSLLVILVSYLTPVWAMRVRENPGLKLLTPKVVGMVLTVLTVFLGISITVYLSWFSDSELAREFLMNRIFAFQGHLWWAVDNHVMMNGPYDRDHLTVELAAILFPGSVASEQVGMKYLMINILGGERAYNIFESGYLYTMAYPAILIATFSYPLALFIQLLAGMLFFVLLYLLHFAIVHGHVVRATVSLTVLFPYITTFAAGGFTTFATTGMATKLAILGGLEAGILWLHIREVKRDSVPVSG